MFEQVTMSKSLADSIAAARWAWIRKHSNLPATTLLVAPALLDEARAIVPPGLTVQASSWMLHKVAVGVLLMPDAKEVAR